MTSIIDQIEDVEVRLDLKVVHHVGVLEFDWPRDAHGDVNRVGRERIRYVLRNQRNGRRHGFKRDKLSLGEDARVDQRLPCRSRLARLIGVVGGNELVQLLDAAYAASPVTIP